MTFTRKRRAQPTEAKKEPKKEPTTEKKPESKLRSGDRQ
jgi:hypothetical protein